MANSKIEGLEPNGESPSRMGGSTMSSSRKRAATQKANNEADHLRQRLMLTDHHYAVMQGMAEEFARRNDWLRGVLRELVACREQRLAAEMTWWEDRGFDTKEESDAAKAIRDDLLVDCDAREPAAWAAAVDVLLANNLCEQRLTDDNHSADLDPSARHGG